METHITAYCVCITTWRVFLFSSSCFKFHEITFPHLSPQRQSSRPQTGYVRRGLKWRQRRWLGWGGGGGNNLQMKNNPFRSNAISRRADGQTEQQSCQSTPSLLKQRLRRGEHGRRGESGEGWRDHSKGGGRGWGRSRDRRMRVGGGGLGWWRGWIFCSDIAGLAPSELDIKSPCQVLPTLKDTWH